jgi:hypothetical protein
MAASRPFHQQLIERTGAVCTALLALGSILDTISTANAWISEPVTYIGSAVLLVGVAVTHLALRFAPLTWMVKGKLTKINRLGATSLAIVFALIGLLWFPRAAQWIQSADRTTINWVELLWSGEKLSVDIGDLPEHARGSLLVEGRSYIVWYQHDPCLWQSNGPAKLPKSMGGEVVEQHYNKAGWR